MERIYNAFTGILPEINGFLWGIGTILLIFGAGIFFTIRTKFFQFRYFGHIFKATLFSKDNRTHEKNTVSRFQALSTALAASMGTGNIVGVAAAVAAGGAGAGFWMWVSALFGMATGFAENALGVKFKNTAGKTAARGPMLYLEYGLKSPALAVVFAAACILASFGIGNMTQANAISSAASVFGITPKLSGIITLILAGFIIMRGGKAITKATERIIPAISLFYIIGAVIVIFIFRDNIAGAFREIFKSAFGLNGIAGGITGAAVKRAVTIGLQRGIFSNEAGMGSSVLVHTSTGCDEPVIMGMWAILEVFIDTILCCTLTALVILCTAPAGAAHGGNFSGGALNGTEGVGTVIKAFESGLGGFAKYFIAVSTVVFAFSTILGWCYYGVQCVSYISESAFNVGVYKLFFLAAVYFGAVSNLSLVWELSDIFNVFMLIPNLLGILILNRHITELTTQYTMRLKQKKPRGRPRDN